MGLKPGYKQTDIGPVPSEWRTPVLKQHCSKLNVGFVGVCEPHYTGEHNGVMLIRTGNLYDGKFNLEDLKYVSRSFHEVNKKSQTRNGDILIARHGSSGNAVLVPLEVEEANTLNIVIIRTIASELDNVFASYAINSDVVKKQVSVVTAGSTQGVINTKELAKLIIPLPPLDEQHAIATALSDLDLFLADVEYLIAKKRQIKQGVMQKLLTGKKRLPGFSGEWEVRQFGDVAQPRKERIDPRRTGIQEFCVELEHIEQGTGRLISYSATGEGASLKSVFKKGDVLFGKLRAYLRKYWLADRDGVCSTEIWALVANCVLLIPEYLFQLVREDRLVEVASTAYGTHMPRSDWKVVKNYEVPLPSIKEQIAIAEVLSDMDAEVAALEDKLAKARRVKQGMMQKLLTGSIRLV